MVRNHHGNVPVTERLALFGGPPTLVTPIPSYRSIGNEEAEAARRVVESGNLSEFIGAWGDKFNGGPEVRAFEAAAAEYFSTSHAITVNSWTSGLVAAVGAAGIGPGDEVILTPWTMSATAAAILHWGGVPIFADIDPRTFNLDPQHVEALITPRTRAILAADIFGQSADVHALRELADRNDIILISDTAQSPGAKVGSRFAGTIAHIGGYSLNYHKHIHTGEGGIVVTDDDSLADRVRMIRNHGEAVAASRPGIDLTNHVGHNFRLGEIEAAIGIEQIQKLPELVASRQAQGGRIATTLGHLEGLHQPHVAERNTHVYYVYAMKIDPTVIPATRDALHAALTAEGIPLMRQYQNIHLLPAFREKRAFGSGHYPWDYTGSHDRYRYGRGMCDNAERLNDSEFLGIEMCRYNLDDGVLVSFRAAFEKVWENIDSLRNWQGVP